MDVDSEESKFEHETELVKLNQQIKEHRAEVDHMSIRENYFQSSFKQKSQNF